MYQDKEGNSHIRFLPGLYDTALDFLFPKVLCILSPCLQKVYDVEESAWKFDEMIYSVVYIHRPKSSVCILSNTRNGVHSSNYSIEYHFTKRNRPYVNGSTYKIENNIYVF